MQPRPARLKQIKAHGFTLIELLAVMVIIGLAATLMVVSIGPGKGSGNLEAFSKDLENSIAFAMEEAILFNQQLGMLFDVENINDEQRFVYRFLRFDQEKQRWYEYDDEDLKKGTFPPQVDLTVEVDGEALIVGANKESQFFQAKIDDDDEEKDKARIEPDIVFLSSGETQKFVIAISPLDKGDKRYEISADILGNLSLKLPGQADD